MTIYATIEQEYLFELFHMKIEHASQAELNLFNGILSKYRRRMLTFEEETNIRIYFNSMGTLDGLSEWAQVFTHPPAGTDRK